MSLTISARDWDAYIKRLAALNEAAAEKMREYVRENGFGDMNALIDYAYALVTRYGEGSAALSAAMYDAVAEMSGKLFDPAVPAETADYSQVARTVQGVAKASQDPDAMGSAVGRMVKQAGADTTLQNALRDGAEFAWVPHGDTCAFCITLASRGWQKASQKAVKGGHAEHIHNNCDCTYAIRFDGKGGVAGYDPEKYRAMYDAAEGDTPQEKINAMRRAQYAEDRDEINARKRAAYAERVERERSELSRMYSQNPNTVQIRVLDAPGYREKFNGITGDDQVDEAIYQCAVKILEHRNGTNLEDLYLIDAETGKVVHSITNTRIPFGIQYDEGARQAIDKAKAKGRNLIAIHNHPNGMPPSLDDGSSANSHGYKQGVVVGHNLEVWTYGKAERVFSAEECNELHRALTERIGLELDFDTELWYEYLEMFGMEVNQR